MLKRKIMVVDRDRDVRAALLEALRIRLNGVEFVEAVDGGEALDRLAEGGVVVAITGVHMSRLGGAALVRVAREQDYATEFVVFTGDPFVPDRLEGAPVFRKAHEVGDLVDHVSRLIA